MTKHATIRALQRYGLSNLDCYKIIESIRDDECIWIKDSLVHDSKIFFLQYTNKYIKVVTDNNVNTVITLLPYKDSDIIYLEELLNKRTVKIA